MDKNLTKKQRDEIMAAIRQRSDQPAQPMMKLLIWSLTVSGAKILKRSMDFALSLLAIIVLSPAMLTVAILVKLESPGPIIFRQIRVGKDGKHFNFYKFRSMYQDAEQRKAKLLAENQSADGVIFKMRHDPRVTKMGRIMRKFSIDELPQFFNVLLGDMSLVGPRPPLPLEVAQYNLDDRKRLHVRPGLTCLWQIAGRSDIPFKQQVALDKAYISSQSLWKDFVILMKTIPAVLTGRGAY